MITLKGISLADVQAVYGGPEGDLWELIMGQQIHVGGFESSMDLAERSGIGAGMKGVDLCCCNGAGMRFLVRFRACAAMTGVDATPTVIRRGLERTQAEGMSDRVRFVEADVCHTGLPGGAADFVWGEDAWCYVVDKPALVAEAVRLTRPGGIIAFTDWVVGPAGLSGADADRFLHFMKFPSLACIDCYREWLEKQGARVLSADDTGRFAPCIDLYLEMLTRQLTGDALRCIGYDMELFKALGGELAFVRDLAHAGRIAQGRFIARVPQ